MFGLNKNISFYMCKDFLISTMMFLKPNSVENTETTVVIKIVRRKRIITISAKLVSGKIKIEVDDTDYLIHIPTKTFKKNEDAQLHILDIKQVISDNLR